MSSTPRSGAGFVRGARRATRGVIVTSPRASSRRSAGRSLPVGPGSRSIRARCLSVSFPSAPVGSAHRYVFALPGGGVTSASARAGVEQYSSAIHSARSTRSRGSESSRMPVGVTSFSSGTSEVSARLDDDALELLVAERDLDDRADLDVVVDPVVERAGEAARGGERFDSGDQGSMKRDTRVGGAGAGELRQMREAVRSSRSACVGGAARRGVSRELPVRTLMLHPYGCGTRITRTAAWQPTPPALTVPHPDQRRADAGPGRRLPHLPP